MPVPLRIVVYRSEALLPEADMSNLDILRAALRNNSALGLTGFLVRDRGRFLQAIEGPAAAVELMMVRILQDRRHREVVVLGETSLPRRRFADWSMGYAGPGRTAPKLDLLALRAPDAVAFLQTAARRQQATLGAAHRHEAA